MFTIKFSDAYKAQLGSLAVSGVLLASGQRHAAVLYSAAGSIPVIQKFAPALENLPTSQKVGVGIGMAAGIAVNMYLTKFKAYRAAWYAGSVVAAGALTFLESTEKGREICEMVDSALDRAMAFVMPTHETDEPATEPTMAQ